VAKVGQACSSCRTGGWREDPAEGEKMRTPGVQCVINSRCTSPAPKPGSFGLRLRSKRNTVQRSSMMGIRPWGFAKGGVAMLMLGFKQGSASNRPSPRGIVRFDPLSFRCPDNPGWRGRNACAFFGRSTPGYLLSGLQPRVPVERRAGGGDPKTGSGPVLPRC
jgi:hypothetical protein